MRGVTLDITEQKIAEDARKKSEERNRAILQAIPDLMFLQTRDGVYLDYHAQRHADLLVPAGRVSFQEHARRTPATVGRAICQSVLKTRKRTMLRYWSMSFRSMGMSAGLKRAWCEAERTY